MLITFSGKFSDIVPGTFQSPAESTGSTVTAENIATVDFVSTTMTAEVESTTEASFFAVGGTFFYIMIGVGGGIIFSFTIIIVCILIGFSVRRKRKSQTFITDTTLDPHNGIQIQGRMMCCI